MLLFLMFNMQWTAKLRDYSVPVTGRRPGAGCVLFFALNFNASALGPGENWLHKIKFPY